MLSLESADIEGFDVFLLFHTDLKSEGCSTDWLGVLADRELAASKRSPSNDGSGISPCRGVGESEGSGGISGNGKSGSGIGGMFIPGGGGGSVLVRPSESVSTSSSGSITRCLQSSTLFNILWLSN